MDADAPASGDRDPSDAFPERPGWAPTPPDAYQPATLVHPRRERDGREELLLMRKKRGVGAGNVIAPGGKVEPGETPRACAVRETREEVGLRVRELRKVGELGFVFGSDPFTYVHVYDATAFDGTPTETPEGDPDWVPVDDVPYDEMWADDRYWLPHLLDGTRFRGWFLFDADGDELLERRVRTGVTF